MNYGQKRIARHDWKTAGTVVLASIDTTPARSKRKLREVRREEIK